MMWTMLSAKALAIPVLEEAHEDPCPEEEDHLYRILSIFPNPLDCDLRSGVKLING